MRARAGTKPWGICLSPGINKRRLSVSDDGRRRPRHAKPGDDWRLAFLLMLPRRFPVILLWTHGMVGSMGGNRFTLDRQQSFTCMAS
jgi:hypothetical protein